MFFLRSDELRITVVPTNLETVRALVVSSWSPTIMQFLCVT